MRARVEVKLDGMDAALRGLADSQPRLRQATAPVLQSIAQRIRSRARAGFNVYHPHNFFRAKGKHGAKLSPSYRTKQMGEYWWAVQTPGSEAGAKEAQAEFMARSANPQGAALVRALSSVYSRPGGSGGGRILYKARDEMEAEAIALINAAVAKAAAEIEKEVNGG